MNAMRHNLILIALGLLVLIAHSMAFEDEEADAKAQAAMFPKMKYIGVWKQ